MKFSVELFSAYGPNQGDDLFPFSIELIQSYLQSKYLTTRVKNVSRLYLLYGGCCGLLCIYICEVDSIRGNQSSSNRPYHIHSTRPPAKSVMMDLRSSALCCALLLVLVVLLPVSVDASSKVRSVHPVFKKQKQEV